MDAMQDALQQLAKALTGTTQASVTVQSVPVPRKNPTQLPNSLITPALPPSTSQTPPTLSHELTGISNGPNATSSVDQPALIVSPSRSSVFSGFAKLFWPANVASRVSTSASD